MGDAWCPACGRPVDEGDHARCRRVHSDLDPPRYCATCGNRLDVQVYPTGFVATCRRCDGVHPARRGVAG